MIIKCMRTTLDIDPDVLQTAREIGKKEKKTAGKVISEMARNGFYGQEPAVREQTAPYTTKHGVPVLPPTGRLVSQESIQRIRDDEAI